MNFDKISVDILSKLSHIEFLVIHSLGEDDKATYIKSKISGIIAAMYISVFDFCLILHIDNSEVITPILQKFFGSFFQEGTKITIRKVVLQHG